MPKRTSSCSVVVLCVVLLGCEVGGDEHESSPKPTTAAVALIEAMTFTNGTLETSLLPATTAPEVSLVPFPEKTITEQGVDWLVPFGVLDDDASAAVALLIQVDDAKQHFRVSLVDSAPVKPDAGAADESVHCKIRNDVCSQLCDREFAVKFVQAVELEDGRTSAHAVTKFVLDCRKGGKRALCAATDDDDAGN